MKLSYVDSVILVDPVLDEYGTEKIGRMETVPAIVGQALGFEHGSNQDAITADLIVYLDPTHSFLVEKSNRVEGMYVITSEGEAEADAWYRIESVNVGKRSLLANNLDNVQANCFKTRELQSVS